MIARADGGSRDQTSALRRVHAVIADASRRRKTAIAVLAGLVSVAALPPVHQVYALVPALTALVWLLDGVSRPGAAFLVGWAFGLGHFAAGLYWVYYAFLVDAGAYGILAPFAVIGLAILLGLFTGLVAVAAAFGRRSGIARVLLLAAAWTLGEWVRSWAITGFPWNLLGTVWIFSDVMMQPAAWIGTYGLSFVTCAVAAMPAVLADPAVPGRNRLLPFVACGAVMAAWVATGVVRLDGAADGMVQGVRLRLVQPDIPQSLKWRNDLRLGHLSRHITMSREPAADGLPPTHVIWAETAVPYVVDARQSRELLAVIAQAAPPGGHVLFGVPRAEGTGNELRNSLIVIDGRGVVEAVYDKVHLVPFGEYVPFRSILNFSKLAQGRGDFVPGPGLATVSAAGLPPFSPLICYEIIFPGAVVPASGERPRWLLNLTNDAWFGISAGPYQHFASARMRAVEEGLPLVRVANTGISAVVDGYGRVRAAIGLDEAGIVDSPLPEPVGSLTLYSRFGNWSLVSLLLAVWLACRLGRRRGIPHQA